MAQTTTPRSMDRFGLLSWLIIPILSVWFAIGYVVGEINLPAWDAGATRSTVQVAVSPQPNYVWNGEGLVTVWFDDAYISQYTSAAPIMVSQGMSSALAVPTRLVGTPGYMNWTQVQGLIYQGWDISAHTRTHSCSLDNETDQKRMEEIVGSKQDLAQRGILTKDFVTPCGVENEAMKELAKTQFRSLRTSFPGDNPIPLEDPYRIKSYAIRNTTTIEEVRGWLVQAKNEKRWMILMFHGIDESGTEYAVLPNTLREMLAAVRESELQVVTPSQVISIGMEQ